MDAIECKVRRHQKRHVAGAGARCRKNSELFAYSSDRLTQAVGGLLGRAVAAGEIRNDISAEDVLRALVGMSYTYDQPGWQKSVLRLVDVFIDGLRDQRARNRRRIK